MKTMEINELISKLKEYDGELPVKVWSGGAEKPYPISNVAAGTMCAYIGIDDRNLVDLSKIWHDANEMPKEEEWILIQYGEDSYDTLTLSDFYAYIFCARCKKDGDIRWAYVSDLLLKGGEK